MKNVRMVINGLALGVICAGAAALNPAQSNAAVAPGSGGTCCDQAGATCYLQVGDNLIIQSGAYYSSGPCSTTPAAE